MHFLFEREKAAPRFKTILCNKKRAEPRLFFLFYRKVLYSRTSLHPRLWRIPRQAAEYYTFLPVSQNALASKHLFPENKKLFYIRLKVPD